MTSFSIRSFGCRVNQAEAFDWASTLRTAGWGYEADDRRADIIVINTCTLTGRADRDSRKGIRRAIRDNPRARVVATGCLAERDREGLAAIPGVWRVVPNRDKSALPETLRTAFPAPAGPGLPPGDIRPLRARALVKVQDGCDRACRFCVIPSVRGRSVSRPPADALDRVRDLAAEGFREIVLAGIHLGSYGRDAVPRTSLLELLREIDRIPGDFRIRLSSLDPGFLGDSLLDLLAGSRRICPHYHLSLQHGSDRILAAMGREGTAVAYRSLMSGFVRRTPEAALGADFIVGFPGETPEDFEATLSLFEDSPLAYAHVFPFSPRPGTAATGDPPVSESVRAERADRLRRASRRKARKFRDRFDGRPLDGIVVGVRADGLDVLTSQYLNVFIPGETALLGAAVRVAFKGESRERAQGRLLAPEGVRP